MLSILIGGHIYMLQRIFIDIPEGGMAFICRLMSLSVLDSRE